MLSILATAASRCDPSARADGSLKVALSADVLPPVGAGDGVAGGFAGAALVPEAGAAGGAGVDELA